MGVLPAQLGAGGNLSGRFSSGFILSLYELEGRQYQTERLWAGRDGKRHPRVCCVYPFVEMGNPEANRLSRPWVQVIESECWKHPLLFHAPRVNTLLGHLRQSSFESPHDISCLSLSHYFVSPFSKFWLFRTGWFFFFPGKLMLAHPSHIIFIKRLYCIP